MNAEALRQGEALARKMLAVRDGEVQLLKAQLESTEAKLDAARERASLQKALVMEEVRKMAVQLSEAELAVNKWKDLAGLWAELDHPEDIRADTLEGAQQLGERLKELLSEKKVSDGQFLLFEMALFFGVMSSGLTMDVNKRRRPRNWKRPKRPTCVW